ncbi:MAG: PaaI family thioesterase [Dehalococcoidia bacterium]|nr:MAG: PaaI family thioesterase [Dehalococcoidia bacterium]
MEILPDLLVDTEKSPTMCFGCGKDNPIGLKLEFRWNGEVARAEFTPDERHQGWSNIVHGGIITCLLDEALNYPPYFVGLPCLTAKMEVRLRRPVMVGEPLVLIASIVRKNRRLVETRASLELGDGTIAAEATGTMFVIRGKGAA